MGRTVNTYKITQNNFNDMFCHACAAVVILEPLMEHNKKSSESFGNIANKYFMQNITICAELTKIRWKIDTELFKLESIFKTCDQLMSCAFNFPEGDIEISLDEALDIVYYSKQYEIMRDKYNALESCRKMQETR